ncbi:MAG: GPP34 family phosphoprotein, partial [Henriciella sp.]
MTLTIPESLMLLSRKNETGAKQGDFVEFALAGGAIGELMLRGHLGPLPDKPKKMQLANTGATGDRFLDA